MHVFLLFLTLGVLLPSPSFGFAAWLKCNRGLEEDEIIMNNKVKHADDETDYSVVKLAIYDESGSKRVDVASDEGSIVWIDDGATPLFFKVGLDQATIAGLSDIQFVVETTPFHASPSPRPATPSPNVPSINTQNSKGSNANKTSFTGIGLMCDGKRAHARGKNGSVTYTLVPNKSIDGIMAEVWGGWSEYHGAVTLTPRIIFKRRDSAASEMRRDHQGEL